MRARLASFAAAATAIACIGLAACSGSSGSPAIPACAGPCAGAPLLTEADVRRILAQAVAEAQARGMHAHVAVVDRVGNVLAVYSMPGAPATIAIASGLGVSGGLDGIAQGTVPATLAAIAKALTGSYLSSQGHAFTTRTASQIIQEHFDPGELGEPGGPLYGVQFSQLTCSDVNRNRTHGTVGPKRSPLGLAADPGGLPLYKDGVLVGGIGVEADGLYSLDREIGDTDSSDEEIAAVAGTAGFPAPDDIRADRITADGRTFRYVDSTATRTDPPAAPPLAALPGSLVAVDGYTAGDIQAGVAYGTAASGVRPDDGAFAAAQGWILVDAANANRYPPRAAAPGAGDLRAAEVQALLAEALAVARHARAQIRRPLGSSAQVTIAVVDLAGNVLGLVRTPDGALFGVDVAVQKARTAMFFSSPGAADAMRSFLPARYLTSTADVPLARYLDDARAFLGDASSFTGATAFSTRAIGNLHRPFYPDGIDGKPHGPFSTPFAQWSPFNVGFQLDLVHNQIVKGVLGDLSTGCASRLPAGVAGADGYPPLADGAQIFPGGLPVYRGNRLVGAVGVSGDGVDQDDMIAFLGIAHAGEALGGALGNAPAAMRADQLAPQGVRLRYVQCPQAPFLDSTDENACAGQ
ncbi:MAG TPA: heme-binding protein [Usitatibacter sp.]|nr:heme-binding protein [Usitatibacter sp.]